MKTNLLIAGLVLLCGLDAVANLVRETAASIPGFVSRPFVTAGDFIWDVYFAP